MGFCAAWLACDGGDSELSFQDMCDKAVTKMCGLMSTCSSPIPDCVAQLKTQNCDGGPEVFCGSGSTYQPSKASSCLATLDALRCGALIEQPAACTPDALCASQGPAPQATPGEACQALGDPDSCDPKASLCFAAGTASSCPSKSLCLGDSTGTTCAARCATDADCATAGMGLVCMQDCTVAIINGFCMTPKTQAKFMQHTCTGTASASAAGISGWSL